MSNIAYKPGRATTEYLLARMAVAFSAACVIIGIAIAYSLNLWAGLAMVLSGCTIVCVSVAAYVKGRSNLKIAAENNRPPPSRVL